MFFVMLFCYFRKAVKAAIVLQPLLGITNSLQMVYNPYKTQILYFTIWSVGTTFLVSFQGFFAALFYCFLNGEVRKINYFIISNFKNMSFPNI